MGGRLYSNSFTNTFTNAFTNAVPDGGAELLRAQCAATLARRVGKGVRKRVCNGSIVNVYIYIYIC